MNNLEFDFHKNLELWIVQWYFIKSCRCYCLSDKGLGVYNSLLELLATQNQIFTGPNPNSESLFRNKMKFKVWFHEKYEHLEMQKNMFFSNHVFYAKKKSVFFIKNSFLLFFLFFSITGRFLINYSAICVYL